MAAWKLGWRVDWRRQPPPSSHHCVLHKDNSNPGWQCLNIASRLSCLIPDLDTCMSPRVWELLGLTLPAYRPCAPPPTQLELRSAFLS